MKLVRFILLFKVTGGFRLFRLSILLAVFFLFTNFAFLQLNDQNVLLASPATDEAELFKSKCGKCHDPELALEEYRSAEVWQETISRMKDDHNADISEDEADQLVKYHVDRQNQEAAIFKQKCEKCHPGEIFLKRSLSADQIRSTIKRMQQKAGNSIEDKDIETIVKYHSRSQKAVLQENLQVFEGASSVRPGGKKRMNVEGGMALFAKKCSECHELGRALSLIKDPEVWDQTIKRMQYYSKGGISDQQVEELVGFHVTEQEREVNTFKETCTRCHDDQRINSRSMSEEQWLATIKRMQEKAPELISDEKINLLTAYFHRRELTLAKVFSGKCQICHSARGGGSKPFQTSRGQLGGVVVLASEEFGGTIPVKDLDSLVSSHIQRQDRNMLIYEKNCETCHPGGPPKRQRRRKADKGERSRAEWISFIATLQGQEINKEVQITINSQIDYHISKF